MERALEEADGLLNTFSALLRIAQIEAGARRSAFRTVDVSEVMRAVAEAYMPSAEEGGRTLRAEIVNGLKVGGDRDLLVQMLANLVENALNHTPVGTTAVMRLSAHSGEVITEVADDGPGIPAEERASVLRRFTGSSAAARHRVTASASAWARPGSIFLTILPAFAPQSVSRPCHVDCSASGRSHPFILEGASPGRTVKLPIRIVAGMRCQPPARFMEAATNSSRVASSAWVPSKFAGSNQARGVLRWR
ncbi:MAG: HAMP domain-containing histidine kinase [Hyphomicrobiales bacterium]|nr:HAMP domain-containing histidine kinase [Hyphomicrobiales bacterium]